MKLSSLPIGIAVSFCLLTLAACDIPSSSTTTGMKDVESTQKRLEVSTPAPTINQSLERKNIAERLSTLNSQNMNGYIYLINFGKIMAYYPVRGKVSSLNSFLTPQEKFVWTNGGTPFLASAPDLDGSYGENVDGIFFFTTNGTYVEWKGDFLFSNAPLTLTQQPELVLNITK